MALLACVASSAAPISAAPTPAPAATSGADQRERAANAAFRAGRYAEALELYEQLRRETGHPVYLRNIGRCHQMQREPAAAIRHFEQYLAAKPSMTASERREIEIYIAEMEQLRALLAAGPPLAAPLPPPVQITAPRAAAAPEKPVGTPFYRSGWVWAGLGALVAGTVTAVVLTRSPSRIGCPAPAECR